MSPHFRGLKYTFNFNHLTNEDEDEDDDSYVVKFNQPLKLSSEERYLVIKFIW